MVDCLKKKKKSKNECDWHIRYHTEVGGQGGVANRSRPWGAPVCKDPGESTLLVEARPTVGYPGKRLTCAGSTPKAAWPRMLTLWRGEDEDENNFI